MLGDSKNKKRSTVLIDWSLDAKGFIKQFLARSKDYFAQKVSVGFIFAYF